MKNRHLSVRPAYTPVRPVVFEEDVVRFVCARVRPRPDRRRRCVCVFVDTVGIGPIDGTTRLYGSSRILCVYNTKYTRYGFIVTLRFFRPVSGVVTTGVQKQLRAKQALCFREKSNFITKINTFFFDFFQIPFLYHTLYVYKNAYFFFLLEKYIDGNIYDLEQRKNGF